MIAPRMIDSHAHIVYGVDDGAIDAAMSLSMLRDMQRQGVGAVLCTSHSSIDMEKYHAHFDDLCARARVEGITVRLYRGCEVACGRLWMHIILRQIRENYLPLMNGSNCILAEFAPYTYTDEIIDCVSQLQQQTNLQVVIAHPERYRALQTDYAAARSLTDMGALLQVNAYSLAEEEFDGTRHLAQWLVTERLASLLGSDAHRSDHRPPRLDGGMAYIRAHCDADYADDLLWRNAQRLMGCEMA